jgi:hypothetical protein
VTAYDFDHGGIFTWRQATGVYIGSVTTRPSFHEPRAVVSPTVAEVTVWEDQYVPLQLPAGGYWLVDSKTAAIDVIGCAVGAVTGRPPRHTGPRPTIATST